MLAVLAAIWVPELAHWQVDRTDPPLESIAQAKLVPGRDILREVGGMSLAVGLGIPETELIPAAEEILAGRLRAPAFFHGSVPLQGYPLDMQRGPPTFQLAIASLAIETALLDAFERTGDPRYFALAIQRLQAFADHEARQRSGTGFLWNDHAIAARVPVLSRFWALIREQPEIVDRSGATLLALVTRSGRLLAKPDHFTVRTNHGVMQNLALLQIAAAFPGLPEASAWRSIALDRLQLQLNFYISSEGFVLEHSAEYHALGLELLEMAVRLCKLNAVEPPPGLIDATNRANAVLHALIRPDGTLPLFGNTNAGVQFRLPAEMADGSRALSSRPPPHPLPPPGNRLFPLSGYAIWWQGDHDRQTPSQTVIAWAKHDGHGHKHADEMSVLFWSGGTDWITNTGYWPYGDRHTDTAYSWSASNAIHEVSEPFAAVRTTRLLASADSARIRMLALERVAATGARLQRQVLQIGSDLLVILDFAENAKSGVETIWTFAPALTLKPLHSGSEFLSSAAEDGRRLTISFAPTARRPTHHRGSEQPWAGWVVIGGKPQPADALRVSAPGPSSATAAVFRTAAIAHPASEQHLEFTPTPDPDNWSLSMVIEDRRIRLVRSGSEITATGLGGSNQEPETSQLTLIAPPDAGRQTLALEKAYSSAVAAFPPWRDLFAYRLKLTFAVLAIAVAIEMLYFAITTWLKRRNRESHPKLMHLNLVIVWLGIAYWSVAFYLR